VRPFALHLAPTRSIILRALAATAVALACAGPASAQSLAGPRPSALWMSVAASDTAPRTSVRSPAASSANRRLLIGAVIGGLAGGLVGHKICRAFGSDGGGCTGDALWWAAAAGMLGGLIGATSAEDADR
jgi:hypothetical protein